MINTTTIYNFLAYFCQHCKSRLHPHPNKGIWFCNNCDVWMMEIQAHNIKTLQRIQLQGKHNGI